MILPARFIVSPVSAAFPVGVVWFTRFKFQASLKRPSAVRIEPAPHKSPALLNSLRVLEWDKLCDSVACFAGTSLGREATKTQLGYLNQTYEESLRLLEETNAAVEMHRHGGFSLDFGGIDVALVKSAIQHAQRDLPVTGYEAIALSSLLQFSEILQLNLRAVLKEDADWHRRLMPLSEEILQMVVNRSLIKLIQQVIDEDGSVKDSASPALRRSREQVQVLEKKLYQLMDSLARSEKEESSFLEVSNVDGRWCIRSGSDNQTNFRGLLLSSGPGRGNIVEPLAAVPLNDELQRARTAVAKAEDEVLLMLAKKMQLDLDCIEMLLHSIIRLDVINARAKYGLSYGGTCPDLILFQDNNIPEGLESREWTLFLPEAYHPLLLQQHRQKLQKAKKDIIDATAEIGRRKMQPERVPRKGEPDINLPALKERVAALEQACPVPVDFFISMKTKVLVITGPNTGGKTVCLKTVGLATMMAKSGLHILSAESVKIPWVDSVFADIGDEQSLSQSLSTFSGHLKQINDILSESTAQSLVLLDEVGAGTNPLEGAALGMALLETFADKSLLTIATTHHGEIKTLKYSNEAFENACMEFDDVKLKPTYKILWGIPGRSNAINIAEQLGLPAKIVEDAWVLYGSANAEINEVIIDMERFKQEFRNLLEEAQNYLKLSRDLHESLLRAKRKIQRHRTTLRQMKLRKIEEAAARARSMLHSKARQFRASAAQKAQTTRVDLIQLEKNEKLNSTKNTIPSPQVSMDTVAKTGRTAELPKVGTLVHVSSLGRKGTVVKVDPSREEVVVQSGMMKMRLKSTDFRA
ncbi:hypothetical protein SAY86_018598 [Trapa natans]|uniref:DNA mismatch repair proteins mutS family domain-containing protein n=1 Tax=Trapa natans TaxID=22666 RepID=A0AAN7LFA5_TRANT|nr:hypothetical protein SAY86_018598 [Trapa natans]